MCVLFDEVSMKERDAVLRLVFAFSFFFFYSCAFFFSFKLPDANTLVKLIQ